MMRGYVPEAGDIVWLTSRRKLAIKSLDWRVRKSTRMVMRFESKAEGVG